MVPPRKTSRRHSGKLLILLSSRATRAICFFVPKGRLYAALFLFCFCVLRAVNRQSRITFLLTNPLPISATLSNPAFHTTLHPLK